MTGAKAILMLSNFLLTIPNSGLFFDEQIIKYFYNDYQLGVRMKKIALGETLPIEIIDVVEITGREKFKVNFRDDDGFEGVIYLDVEIPKGKAELKVIHKDL